jgi:hypothetical protein
VLVGGQDQSLGGPVSCATTASNTTTIVIGTQPKVVTVVLNNTSLNVTSVVLTNINGQTLRYPATSGANSPSAAATQTGSSYTVIGTANTQPPSTPQTFEVDATC